MSSGDKLVDIHYNRNNSEQWVDNFYRTKSNFQDCRVYQDTGSQQINGFFENSRISGNPDKRRTQIDFFSLQ